MADGTECGAAFASRLRTAEAVARAQRVLHMVTLRRGCDTAQIMRVSAGAVGQVGYGARRRAAARGGSQGVKCQAGDRLQAIALAENAGMSDARVPNRPALEPRRVSESAAIQTSVPKIKLTLFTAGPAAHPQPEPVPPNRAMPLRGTPAQTAGTQRSVAMPVAAFPSPRRSASRDADASRPATEASGILPSFGISASRTVRGGLSTARAASAQPRAAASSFAARADASHVGTSYVGLLAAGSTGFASAPLAPGPASPERSNVAPPHKPGPSNKQTRRRWRATFILMAH